MRKGMQKGRAGKKEGKTKKERGTRGVWKGGRKEEKKEMRMRRSGAL